MCDTLVALGKATADGSVIFAKNSDRDPAEAHHVLTLPAAVHPPGSQVQCTYISIPQVERTYAVLLAKPFWIWGAEMGANEHGVVIGNEAVFAKVPADKKPGLIGMDFLRLSLERSRDAYEALRTIIDLLEQFGQGGNCGFLHPLYYYNSFLIADRSEAWVLETVGKMWAAEKVRSVRSISNALTIGKQWDMASDDLVAYAVDQKWCRSKDDFDFARCYSDFLYTTFAHGRERQSCSTRLLHEAAGTITPQTMMAILRTHAPDDPDWSPDKGIIGASICMHAGFGPARGSQSVGSLVSHIQPESAIHWVTATSAPCTSVFKPVWLDAGIPLDEPQPTGKYDAQTTFWRHEILHREALRNLPAALAVFSAERDELEAGYIERALEYQHKPAEERLDFSRQCFEEGDQVRRRWLEKVRSVTPRRQRLLYRLAWRRFARDAGLRFKEYSED